MSESEAKRCLVRSLSSWSHKTLESNMSVLFLSRVQARPLRRHVLRAPTAVRIDGNCRSTRSSTYSRPRFPSVSDRAPRRPRSRGSRREWLRHLCQYSRTIDPLSSQRCRFPHRRRQWRGQAQLRHPGRRNQRGRQRPRRHRQSVSPAKVVIDYTRWDDPQRRRDSTHRQHPLRRSRTGLCPRIAEVRADCAVLPGQFPVQCQPCQL